MSINKIGILNYISIRKFVCKLGKINVFVGPTDSGKSNIVRALRDACFNASGGGFVTHGQKKCLVVIDNVRWERGEGINRYTVDTEEYVNVGRNSPDEVRRELKIDDTYWDASLSKRLQFIEQFEPKFFLAYPDSLNAKILGKVSGIQRIYAGTKQVNKEKRDLSSRVDFINEECAVLDDDLQKYKHVDSLCSMSEKIKKALGALSILETEYEVIDNTYTEHEELSEEINQIELSIEKIHVDEKMIDDLIVLCSDYELLYEYMEFLKELETMEEEVNEIDIDEKLLSRYEAVVNEYEKTKNVYEEYVELKHKIQEVTDEIQKYEKLEKNAVGEFDALLKKSDVCPLTKIKYYDTCKKDILKND